MAIYYYNFLLNDQLSQQQEGDIPEAGHRQREWHEMSVHFHLSLLDKNV